MDSILQKIIDKREADKKYQRNNFGFAIPAMRRRSITPFLPERGVILEIKRASPSKGDIQPDLIPQELALAYQKAGAAAISVLTEFNAFKGSLQDIMDVAVALDAQNLSDKPAILRKDFLTEVSEIEVSYKVGADAVLLIARILETEKLIKMALRCSEMGLGALIELRTEEDIQKYHAVMLALKQQNRSAENFAAGTNTRDLATFAIDLLKPLSYGDRLPKKMIFESGIHTASAAQFVGSLGFYGILVGEAASKNPAKMPMLVEAFRAGGAQLKPDRNTLGWKQYARLLGEKTLPFVKICGITKEADALQAASLGATFLGFVMVQKSPRNLNGQRIKAICNKVRSVYPAVQFVGVITDPDSPEGCEAQALAEQGILDAIQLHNCSAAGLPFWHYSAVRVGSEEDLLKLDDLLNSGQPRVLLDASVAGMDGGTGVCISEKWVMQARKKAPLWLAGGINPDNVQEMLRKFSPELLDVSSGVEKTPGIKDELKLQRLFENIKK